MRKNIIFIMVILPFILVAQTEWTVIPAGGGDYTTITAALTDDDLEDGDIVIVYESTYNENVTITKDITLKSRGPSYVSTTIINGSQNPTGTLITVNASLENVQILDFTIRSNTINSGKGILIRNSEVTVSGCSITDIKYAIELDGYIAPYETPIIEYNKIFDNYIGIFCDSDIWPDIENNEIYANYYAGIKLNGANGGTDEVSSISHNVFYDHDDITTSTAIHTDNVSLNLFANLIYGNNYAIRTGLIEPDYINLSHDTISDNRWIINSLGNDIDIVNCIVWNNGEFLPYAWPTCFYTINYSCIPTTVIPYGGDTGVIHDDPLFVDAGSDYSLNWDSTEKSPCIDTGDPNSPDDPDGTPADMGAIYKEHEVKTYEFAAQGMEQEWNWLCFDILDIYMPTTTNQIQNLLDPIKYSIDEGYQELLNFYYQQTSPPPTWIHGPEVISSPLGYKILMDQSDTFDVYGYRCPANTTFTVYANSTIGDWIGYFIGKTQHVYDAFDGYLDNIYEIKHKDWSIRSGSGVGGWPDVPYTLSPGDMVVVKCEEQISNFCWIDQAETERYSEPEAQSFTYTEEADYIPIYVELDETDLPDEIGVIVDGECKGAKVVDDEFVDICAYITETQTGNVELDFSYGSRGVNTKHKEYIVFDPETGYSAKTAIDLSNKQDYYYVSFKADNNDITNVPEKLDLANYPNPFNPTTTISYSLPTEGEVSIKVYNTKGQQVKQLVNGTQPEGYYDIVWDGKDEAGRKAASGIYYYQIKACGKTINKKMLMLK